MAPGQSCAARAAKPIVDMSIRRTREWRRKFARDMDKSKISTLEFRIKSLEWEISSWEEWWLQSKAWWHNSEWDDTAVYDLFQKSYTCESKAAQGRVGSDPSGEKLTKQAREAPAPMHSMEKTAENPQDQTAEKVVAVPEPQVVEKSIGVPQVQTVEKVVQMPAPMTEETIAPDPMIAMPVLDVDVAGAPVPSEPVATGAGNTKTMPGTEALSDKEWEKFQNGLRFFESVVVSSRESGISMPEHLAHAINECVEDGKECWHNCRVRFQLGVQERVAADFISWARKHTLLFEADGGDSCHSEK